MGMQHDPEGQFPPFADHYPTQISKKVPKKVETSEDDKYFWVDERQQAAVQNGS
jgi:hypothetical protein